MKIFNRGAEAAKAPEAAAQPAKIPAGALALKAPAKGPAPAAVVAPKAAEPAVPASPDLTAILDANVKEMSEKIARLTSTIETQTADRSTFEEKLDAMEDRMRKLSSLTEMISAQYNPFVGDAPEHRELPPSPDVGLAAPPTTAGTIPTHYEALPPLPEMASVSPLAAFEQTFDALPPSISFDVQPHVPSQPDAFELPAPQAPTRRSSAAEPTYESSAPHDENVNGVHVWTVKHGFKSSMVLLGWADWLLKAAGDHDGLVALVNYYHNIGWIGEPARDQLLAYAQGLAPPTAKLDASDWRASMDVHERSLLFVEKLKALGARRSG